MRKDRYGKAARGAWPRHYRFLIALGLVGFVGLVYYLTGDRQFRAAEGFAQLGEDIPAAELLQLADANNMGDPNAPIRLVIFDDFTCPACGELERRIKPTLVSRFVESGQLRITRFDFPLGEGPSVLSARAARCAGEQDNYWEYASVLLLRQNEWVVRDGIVDRLLMLADDLGLRRRDFERCLKSDRYAREVTAGRLLALQIGITATPTVVVDGERVDPWQLVEYVGERLRR